MFMRNDALVRIVITAALFMLMNIASDEVIVTFPDHLMRMLAAMVVLRMVAAAMMMVILSIVMVMIVMVLIMRVYAMVFRGKNISQHLQEAHTPPLCPLSEVVCDSPACGPPGVSVSSRSSLCGGIVRFRRERLMRLKMHKCELMELYQESSRHVNDMDYDTMVSGPHLRGIIATRAVEPSWSDTAS